MTAGREMERVAGAVAAAATAGLAVVAVVTMAASPLVMRLLASGVDDPAVRDAEIRLGTVFLLVFLPQIVLYGVGLVATGALHAERRFTWPAAAPIANNVVVIVGLRLVLAALPRRVGLAGAGADAGEIAVLAGGTTLGVVALTVVPGRWPCGAPGFRLRLRWQPRDPKVRRLARHGGWAVVQVLATQARADRRARAGQRRRGRRRGLPVRAHVLPAPVRAGRDARGHCRVPGAQPLGERP